MLNPDVCSLTSTNPTTNTIHVQSRPVIAKLYVVFPEVHIIFIRQITSKHVSTQTSSCCLQYRRARFNWDLVCFISQCSEPVCAFPAAANARKTSRANLCLSFYCNCWIYYYSQYILFLFIDPTLLWTVNICCHCRCKSVSEALFTYSALSLPPSRRQRQNYGKEGRLSELFCAVLCMTVVGLQWYRHTHKWKFFTFDYVVFVFCVLA